MESINYKRIFSQKIEHEKFIKTLENMNYRDIDENQEESLIKILNFLNDWLVEHILVTDKLITE